MQGDKTLKEHENLMNRMARTLGADLDEAELRGDLPPEERFTMLLSCTGCSDPEGCQKWLDEHPRPMPRRAIAATATGSPSLRASTERASRLGRPHERRCRTPLGRRKRHYWLALGMAQASGADLQRALEEGRITHGDWADVVTRCRGCGWTEGCDCWMAAQDGRRDRTAGLPQCLVFRGPSGTDQPDARIVLRYGPFQNRFDIAIVGHDSRCALGAPCLIVSRHRPLLWSRDP
jgi:hypothetical protein